MRIEYEGEIHEFPDDFTDSDVAKALKAVDAEKATPSPSVPEPASEKGIIRTLWDRVTKPRAPASQPTLEQELESKVGATDQSHGFAARAAIGGFRPQQPARPAKAKDVTPAPTPSLTLEPRAAVADAAGSSGLRPPPAATEADLEAENTARAESTRKALIGDVKRAQRAGYTKEKYGSLEAATKAYLKDIGQPVQEPAASTAEIDAQRGRGGQDLTSFADLEAEVAVKAAADPKNEAKRLAAEYKSERAARDKAYADAKKKYGSKVLRGLYDEPTEIELLSKHLQSIGQPPLKQPLRSPEQYAAELAGRSRGESAILGETGVAVGEALTRGLEAVGWDVVANVLTDGKAFDDAKRIQITRAALEKDKAIDALKAKQAAGEPLTVAEGRALEDDKWFNQLTSMAKAVRDNPGEASEAILTQFIADGPLYLLGGAASSKAIGAIAGGIKTANNANRIRKALAAGEEAVAAERKAQTVAAMRSTPGLVKQSALKNIGINVAQDIPGDVAIGAILNASRGQDYNATDFIMDAVGGGIISLPLGVAKAVRGGGALTRAQFDKVAKAFDIAGLKDEPRVASMLQRLDKAASNQVLMNEGLGVRATGEERVVSPEEAAVSGYSPDMLGQGDILATGATRGREVEINRGADEGTIEEEVATVSHNILRDRALAAPEGPEADLLGRIEAWADAIRAENAARPEGERMALPEGRDAESQRNADIELFTKAYASDVLGQPVAEGFDRVVLPDDIYADFGRIFETATDRRAAPEGALTGRGFTREERAAAAAAQEEAIRARDAGIAADEARRAAETPPAAPPAAAAEPAAETPATIAQAAAARRAQARMVAESMRPVGLLPPPRRTLTDFLPEGAVAETGRNLRRPLDMEAPGPEINEALIGATARKAGREARRPLYQLKTRAQILRADEARIEAITTLQGILTVGKNRVVKDMQAAGISPQRIGDAIRRAESMARTIKATGSYEAAIAKDALKERIIKPPSETIKTLIKRATGKGIEGFEVVPAREALRSVIRQIDLEGKVAAAAKARKEGRNVRALLVQAARTLPPDQRGKMLTAIGRGETNADLAAGLQRVVDLLGEVERQSLVKQAEALLALDPEKMRPEFRDAFNDIMGGVQKSTPTEATRAGLTRLAEWYEARTSELNDPDNPVSEADLIPQSRLDALKRLDQRSLRDMTAEDLRQLIDDANRIVMQNALKNNLIGARDVRAYNAVVDETTDQIKAANKVRQEKDGGREKAGLLSRFMTERSGPEVLLSQIGGVGGNLSRDLYRELTIAKSNVYRIINGSQEMLNEFWAARGKSKDDLVDWRSETVDVTLGGKKVTLTRPQLVSLYALTRNKDTLKEILDPDTGIIQEGFRGEADKRITPTREELNAALRKATDFDIATGEAMMKIFDGLTPMLNDASVKLHGYEKFRTDDYFPRQRDRSQSIEGLGDLGRFYNGKSLENMGLTKTRERSTLPVVLEDAVSVFDKHIQDAARYSEMAVPVRNALRLVGAPKVKDAISQRFGAQAVNEIDDYLKDVAQTRPRKAETITSRIVREAGRAFATGKLGLRATTILNNLFGAAAQVAGVIDEKYLPAFTKNLPDVRPNDAAFKEMMYLDGYFEQRYNRDPFNMVMYGPHEIAETIGRSKSVRAYRDLQNKVMAPIQWAEKKSAIALYKSIRDNTTRAEAVKGMERIFGKNAFNPSDKDIVKQYAAHETMLTMRRTQNAMDDLDKSAIGREIARNPLANIPYVFTSQLFKLNDMARMATLEIQQAGGWANASPRQRRDFARAIGAVIVSAAIIPTAVATGWGAYRRGFKEEKESDKAKRWGPMAQALFNMTDVVSPEIGAGARIAAGAAAGKGISMGRGNYLSEGMASSVGGLAGLIKMLSGHEGVGEKAFRDLMRGSSLTGIPFESVYQIGEGVIKTMMDADPAVKWVNRKYEIQQKLGKNPDGTTRTLNQAMKAGAKLTNDEIRQYKVADRAARAIRAAAKAEKDGLAPKGHAAKVAAGFEKIPD